MLCTHLRKGWRLSPTSPGAFSPAWGSGTVALVNEDDRAELAVLTKSAAPGQYSSTPQHPCCPFRYRWRVDQPRQSRSPAGHESCLHSLAAAQPPDAAAISRSQLRSSTDLLVAFCQAWDILNERITQAGVLTSLGCSADR